MVFLIQQDLYTVFIRYWWKMLSYFVFISELFEKSFVNSKFKSTSTLSAKEKK